MDYKAFFGKLESYTELLYGNTKPYLPTISRLCLMSTFLENGFRTSYYWEEYSFSVDLQWRCGMFKALIYVIFISLAPLGSSIMVLLQIKVPHACGVLIFNIILQQFVINAWNYNFVVYNLSLIGSLLLLIADNHTESNTSYAELLSLGENKLKNYLQLVGRCFLASTIVSFIYFKISFFQVLLNVSAPIILISIIVGFKAETSAKVMVGLLCRSVLINPWWSIPHRMARRASLRRVFFLALSLMGGFLMIVARGPGEVSVDHFRKKRNINTARLLPL